MSFGGGDSATVRNAIEYAYSRGVIMVASSGNSGANSKQYPCGYEEVICVGATNSDNTGASYSNYGSWVDLVAPGTGIYSTGFDDRYVSLSGTSMSTPMVAGIIGLMRGLFNLNQSEIVTALKDTGTPIDFSGTSINQTNIYEAILSLDNINPEISLVSPIDGYSNLALNQTLVCGASDWQLSSIKLSVWDSNGLFYNETRIVSGISNESSFELTLEADTYNWNCFVEDVQSNGAYASENYSISTTGSSVNLDSPENNSYFNSNPVSFNCSVQNSIGNENSNMTFNILNESGLLHSKTVDLSGNSNQSTFNYSFSDQGDYIWSCSSYNVNGELSSGEDHIISYDSILPVVTLEGPASGLSFESNSQEMTFEFEVSEVSDCDLIVDGSERGSLNNALNGSITEDFSPEDYSWKISCEDPSGNVGDSEIRSFTVEEPEEVVEDEDDDEESEGGAGGGGGGAGASTPGSTVTSPAEVTPPVEEVVEEVVEQVQQEPVIEEVVEESGNTGITGNAVDGFDFDLSNLEKYRNRVNIFVVFLLAITGILFFRDYKYEKEISKEMDVLEKE